MLAFLKLERLKIREQINQFAFKAKLNIKIAKLLLMIYAFGTLRQQDKLIIQKFQKLKIG
jgi:hypothetical protein